MSILAAVTTSNSTVYVKMARSTTYITLGEAVVEIKSSKTREERQMVENTRRPSVQFEDGVERCKERRGSRNAYSIRRKSSVAEGEAGELCLKKRHGSMSGDKREVLVTKG